MSITAEWARDAQAQITDASGSPVDQEAIVRQVLAATFDLVDPYVEPLEPYFGNGCWLISVPREVWRILRVVDHIQLTTLDGYTVRMVPMS